MASNKEKRKQGTKKIDKKGKEGPPLLNLEKICSTALHSVF